MAFAIADSSAPPYPEPKSIAASYGQPKRSGVVTTLVTFVLNTTAPTTTRTAVAAAPSRATAAVPAVAARTPSAKGTFPERAAAFDTAPSRATPGMVVTRAAVYAIAATAPVSITRKLTTTGPTTIGTRTNVGRGSRRRALAKGPSADPTHPTSSEPAAPANAAEASGRPRADARWTRVAPSCSQTSGADGVRRTIRSAARIANASVAPPATMPRRRNAVTDGASERAIRACSAPATAGTR
jgi:hypothetical protein